MAQPLKHPQSESEQDAAVAETVIIQDARGQAPAKQQRRAVQLHQRRLQQLPAAMLRRPRWPQECAGGAERIRTLRSLQSLALNHCFTSHSSKGWK